MSVQLPIHGVIAEFSDATQLLRAAEEAHAAGYRQMDAYSPFPIHGLSEAIGFRSSRLPMIVLAGGILGAVGGFAMQYYATVIAYPLNIGGKPLNSWPAYIPVTFECAILAAALSAILGMLALNGLPEPYHPVFHVPRFEFASRDHFFLCIEATDPKFNLQETRQFLQSLEPREVSDVPS